MNLQNLKGIGEKNIEYLYKADIYTMEDLVTYYPYRYQVLKPESLETTLPLTTVTINAKVVEVGKVSFIRKKD